MIGTDDTPVSRAGTILLPARALIQPCPRTAKPVQTTSGVRKNAAMMISNLTNRLRSVCESVILPLRSVWKNLAAIYRELEPVRLSVIIVALSALAFLLVPQGTDLLIGLAEDAGRGMRLPSVLGFFSALAYFCLGNWYWPRFLLNCDFARPKRSEHLNVRVAYELRLHTPRILGILPACVIGFAFLSNRAPGQGAYLSLGLASFVLAVLLYGAFIARRSFLDRPLHVSKGNSLEHPQKGAKHAGRCSSSRSSPALTMTITKSGACRARKRLSSRWTSVSKIGIAMSRRKGRRGPSIPCLLSPPMAAAFAPLSGRPSCSRAWRMIPARRTSCVFPIISLQLVASPGEASAGRPSWRCLPIKRRRISPRETTPL